MIEIEKRTSYLKTFSLLLIIFILFKMVNSSNIVETLSKVVKPFIWAFVIAFFLNVLLVKIEKKYKSKRWLNILTVYVVFIGIIVLFFAIITPSIVESVRNLAIELPDYIYRTQRWLRGLPTNAGKLDKYGIVDEIQSILNDIRYKVNQGIMPLLNKTLTQVVSFTSGILDFILGIIISIYILKDKEEFANGFKKLIYSIFHEEKAETIMIVQQEIKVAFSKFFVGKIIDSAIIGILCFIGLLIMKVQYSLLISLIVGVTNMIPYFGPFIGMVPAAIITLFDKPIKALWVTIFIFALQQFDGLYLGPKILGTQVGIKPFWIITGILIGGGFFGVWGMLFAVPVVAVIRSLIQRYIERQYN